MKYLLLFLIRIYWNLIPVSKRNICLFKESCSRHVYRITKEKGFIAGVNALKFRIATCRPQYELFKVDDMFILKLKNGSLIYENEISPFLLPPHNYKYLIKTEYYEP